MHRELLKARLPQLPPLPSTTAEGDDEGGETDSFPSTLAPPPKPNRRTRTGKDYSPLSAAGHFADALEITIPFSRSADEADTTATFRTYYTPPTPSTSSPAPLTYPGVPPLSSHDGPAKAPWALNAPAATLDKDERSKGKGVVFVCVHGAGYSGLSWACFAKSIVEKGGGNAGVLAYDARGHGKTRIDGRGEEEGLDMSLENMTTDLVHLVRALFPVKDEAPSLVLVGHSMGGAVAVSACPLLMQVADVVGLVVLDVVEGTAIDALQGMEALIASQPKGFDSVEKGIEWHIRTKTLNNAASARISVPSLLVPPPTPPSTTPLRENKDYVVWRANLSATQPFWEGWFTGLSKKFLECKTAKLLLLAGTDRLDKELMIGQMQGKYQLDVFQDVGHCVQEDAPDRTADLLLSFWMRNDRTDVLKGVKKVGEL